MKKEFYVIFEEADHWFPLYAGLDPDYSHVYTYEHQLLDGYDIFLKNENTFNAVDNMVFFGNSTLFEEAIAGKRYVKITVDVAYKKHYFDLMLLNCVTLSKKQLGINKPWILTPKQLYRQLIRMGGKEI